MGQLVQAHSHRNEPASAGQLPDAAFERQKGLLRPANFLASEHKAKKLASTGRNHPALILVDLKFQLALKEPLNRGQYPFAGTLRFYHDDEIVGVAGKAMAAFLKLPVQLMQQDIRQKRRKRAALRHTPAGLMQSAILRESGAQVFADQGHHPFIPHMPAHVVHQHVMIDAIKELTQVHTHGHAITINDITAHLANRLMGGSPGSEAIAVLREGRINPRSQNLCYGLLNHPIQHGGDTQWAGTACDIDPSEITTKASTCTCTSKLMHSH
ncbi:MAG: hypothetical protein AUJ57_04400 [Zetaproteobacteria bacterium CG1_02_53_45]|nr:MAG: hypothetical protein AUJ57_04400 [Zetaproteobacteria bacterium CG1_02_53_45]